MKTGMFTYGIIMLVVALLFLCAGAYMHKNAIANNELVIFLGIGLVLAGASVMLSSWLRNNAGR